MSITSSISRRNPSGTKGLNSYPSPFFDLSSQYMPPSVKEMFKWCQFLYITHSEIAPVINKKCSYVITDLIYEVDNIQVDGKNKEIWQELLEQIINIKQVEFKLLLDLEVYGNSFCSISYPFERYMRCPHCKSEQLARDVMWKFANMEFRGVCKKCNIAVQFIARDKPIRNRKKIRVIRWNPQQIDVQYNPFTDRSIYVYRIPTWLKKRLADHKNDQNRALVEDTPIEFLKAIKDKKNIQFKANNIYHFKNPSVSMDDDSFGLPPMLAIFKDAWLYQTYRKAQEAIAVDHILPMTLLIPTPPSGNVSPHMSTNLQDWASKMQFMISRWRRDPNGIFTVPFAATTEQIRGDAKSLNVFEEMNQIRQQITGGLDVPQEMIFGNMNWTGSSITLRILENTFIARSSQLTAFLREFIIPNLQRFCSLPKIVVRHADFKMADDVQQKQIALNLRQTNTISDQTTIEELGFDYVQEMERRAKEQGQRLNEQHTLTMASAETQGQAMGIQAKYQALAQIDAQQATRDALVRNAESDDPKKNNPLNMAMIANQMSNQAGMTGPISPEEQDKRMAPPPTAKKPSGQTKKAEAESPTAHIDWANQTIKEGEDKFPTPTMSPLLVESLANHFMKSTPDHMKDVELAMIQKANPELARAIVTRRKLIQKQGKDIKPLPDQKPPTSARSHKSSV